MPAEDGHRLRLASSPRRGAPALFLDRDGTLIEDHGYLADPAGVRLLPAVVAALRRFRDAGYALVLVTNQSGIGRGFYGWDDYEAVAGRLRELLAEEGLAFDAELACAHAPGEGEGCTWRKPAPGMLAEAARQLGLDLSRSLLVGDKLSDIEAAAAAGLPCAVHVATGAAGERAKLALRRGSINVVELDDLSTLAPCAS